jgi:glycosyltransferase involved in cell wall biosynthesis
MNIYYLSSSIIPSKSANSVHVMKMCNAFMNNGHNITLFAKKPQTKSGDSMDLYKLYDVMKFPINRIMAMPIRGIGSLFYSYGVLKEINKMNSPDLFYGRDLWGLLFISNKNIPIIYEAHSLPLSKLRKLAEKKLFLNKNFRRLIVISKALKDEYINLYPFLSEMDVLVAHDGADIPQDEFLNKNVDIKNKKIIVGYVGHLYSGRGIELIIQLAKEFCDIEFIVIGGTDIDVKRWKKETTKYNNIVFYGYIPHGELYKKYQEIDILLAPYQNKVAVAGGKGDTSRWMSPLKIFEYMSYKKPMLVSNISVLKEVLIDEYNCLFCDPENIDEWLLSLKKVINDRDLAFNLGKNAYDDLKKYYLWGIRAEKVIKDC